MTMVTALRMVELEEDGRELSIRCHPKSTPTRLRFLNPHESWPSAMTFHHTPSPSSVDVPHAKSSWTISRCPCRDDTCRVVPSYFESVLIFIFDVRSDDEGAYDTGDDDHATYSGGRLSLRVVR